MRDGMSENAQGSGDALSRGHMAPIDLHVHSNCSDGTLSPRELVDHAIKNGLAAFALTDHDTVDGLDEAIKYAAHLRTLQESAQGVSVPSDEAEKESVCAVTSAVPEIIPGIELSTEYQGADIHVMGLYIDYQNETFRNRLQEFVDSRTNRNRKMCDMLQQAGVSITYEELLAANPGAVITRAHYARYMLEKGYVKSRQEAFDRYVGDHAPCYIPREKITPAQAVELLLQAKGAPVLAHPILYHMSDDRLDTLVRELKGVGLMGIEAIYSTYSPADERQMRALAAKYGLFISGGSDFHGANKPGLDMGVGYGKLFVPQELLEDVRRAL